MISVLILVVVFCICLFVWILWQRQKNHYEVMTSHWHGIITVNFFTDLQLLTVLQALLQQMNFVNWNFVTL